jgi:hypothetical protein
MARKLTKHHLVPKVRRSDYKKKKVLDIHRTLKLWDDKHSAWHFLFKTMTLQEIIMTLSRVHRIKFEKEFEIKQPTIYY